MSRRHNWDHQESCRGYGRQECALIGVSGEIVSRGITCMFHSYGGGVGCAIELTLTCGEERHEMEGIRLSVVIGESTAILGEWSDDTILCRRVSL
jgi:hypothetical protein